MTNWLRQIVIITFLHGAAFAQEPEQPAPQPEAPKPTILVSSDEDYKLGPRDVIEILIEDAPELSGTFNISARGTFLMPYLGRIQAAGVTPDELAAAIAAGLRDRYLKDPKVNVAVKAYHSRSFFIQGAVRSPGVYQIEGRSSLMKLIILAGGLGENHGSTAFIIREVKDTQDEPSELEDSYEMIKVNINGLLKGHFDQNVAIEPGDIINIPRTDVFFVAGEVNAPGSYPLKPGTSLRQAISLARGTTFEAAKDRGIIFREDPETGKREEIRVDVGGVMNGKAVDVQLLANDMIVVPNSRFKSVGGTLLRAFGMATIRRGVY